MGILLLIFAWIVLGAGSVLCITIPKERIPHRIGMVSSLLSGIFMVGAALWVLMGNYPEELYRTWSVPFGSFYIRVDALSAVFLLLIGFIGSISALYGYAYFKEDAFSPKVPRRNVSALWFFFQILLGGMSLVVTAYNGVLFLFAWEIMSLAAFFLVLFEYEKEEVRHAGWIYLVATHGGTAFLLVLFALLGRGRETWDFDGMWLPLQSGLLLVWALIGFGTKAGFVPFHVWLPQAHPAAPSPVSALMSGAMINTGIYGLLRIFSLSRGVPPSGWGLCMGILGMVTGIWGILHALGKRDIKEVLAYSSIENIGIIGMCLGLGLYALSRAQGTVALIAFTAALFHTVNHGIIKTSLFLGAGTILHGTGSRNMEELGGLLKKLPKTGALFGLSSAAIAGLPPLNGFIGEFLLFLGTLLLLIRSTYLLDTVFSILVLFSLGIIGGGAAACFTRLFGIVFLGEPRSEKVLTAHEEEGCFLYPLYVLAIVCLLLGVGSIFLSPFIFGVVFSFLTGISENSLIEAVLILKNTLIPIGSIGFTFIFLSVFLVWIRKRILKNRTLETGPTWDCGYSHPTPRMQYTASSFSSPILHMARRILNPEIHIRLSDGLFPTHGSFTSQIEDLALRYFFKPIFQRISALAGRFYWIQEGRNQIYILYIAITLIVLFIIFLKGIP